MDSKQRAIMQEIAELEARRAALTVRIAELRQQQEIAAAVAECLKAGGQRVSESGDTVVTKAATCRPE